MAKQKMTICLWYDTQAEDAAKLYTSIFKDSKLGLITRYGKEGFEFHHRPEGSVMTVEFSLNGMDFLGLNGGPDFKFNEATSIVVNCETQDEIDHYWGKLTADGGQEVQCGWLKDKFGVSWQITPTILAKLTADPDHTKASRVSQAFYHMKKFDIQALLDAYEGKSK